MDSSIMEREEPGCLFVGVLEDVFQVIEQQQYFISCNVLDALCKSNAKEFPVCESRMQIVSTCLWGINIALSVKRSANSKLTKQIKLMGGNCVKGNLDERIDVLIANKGTTKKVYQAMTLGIPIVKDGWLEQSFNEMKKLPFNSYLLPLFSGCTFTSTDLTFEMRNEIKKIVQNNGGKWEDSLNDETTYLVATNLSSTKKIGIALEENIPIIKPEWIKNIGNNINSKIDNYLINWWCMHEQKSSLFMNCVFQIHPDVSDFSLLEECIHIHSGTFEQNPSYYIVPSYFNINNKNGIYVTPNWIFACIENKKLLNPDIFPLYKPLPFLNSCIKGMQFSLCNLTERTKFADLIRAMGGNVVYKILSNSSYIITQTVNEKISKQSDIYKIPIVIPDFILHIAQTGVIPQIELFAVKNVAQLCKFIRDFNTKTAEETKNTFSNFVRFEDNSSQILTKTQNEIPNDISYEIPSFEGIQQKFSHDPLIELIQSV